MINTNRPLFIPNHPGTLKTGTANSIMNQLLDDVEVWRAEVEFAIDDDASESEVESKEDTNDENDG